MENDCRVMNIVSIDVEESSAESTLSNSFESGRISNDTDSKLDGWTNEKHNSYLDYLESSFVTQLYSLLGGQTQRLSSNPNKSTDQFTVLQNGCWQKVNVGMKRAHLETKNLLPDVNVLCNEETEQSGDKAVTRTSMRKSYPDQTSLEASGQNFKEEEEEKRCDAEVTKKRKREASYDDSSLNDQVVP